MPSYLTPEEVAQQLQVKPTEITSLVEEGKLKAIRIGNKIRIPDTAIEQLEFTCAAVPVTHEPPVSTDGVSALRAGERWCLTRTGKARFRVSGSIADGAEIWPGRMQYPIKFSKQFMNAMLAHFGEGEVAVGGKFDDPGKGSLGEYIQEKLETKMNPAVYVAALLIEEGYATPVRRGYIRFDRKKRTSTVGSR